ncbi:hypothetical protein BDP81DRAFT_486936 [Colletotrichum phormii]|uniref:Uncharacterized protein n=1 Tax=Colletotrichum phormii TaxID=359342 RepID=A0AAJ0A3L6_9PEZI|nr:uncharacterized protein BDP81DRAFT_486936 [Colletotrichum phormii]KAK1655836.1 hypothetical protein BDP81DRAFT_486936 [Colletotrichum phormii]
MKSFTTLVLAANAVTAAVVSKPLVQRNTGSDLNIKIGKDIVNSAAYEKFLSSEVLSPKQLQTRQDGEPDPNRNETNPNIIFVLQCTDAGFRGDCLVFGASPGYCVSYFNFQDANSTAVSDRFNNQVSSLSTNTGGKCQFYLYKGCDNKGDDRGLTSSYNYNLAVALPEDPRTVEYEDKITSWRC